MKFVKNIDETLDLLTTQIDELKEKANDFIPVPEKIKEYSKPILDGHSLSAHNECFFKPNYNLYYSPLTITQEQLHKK